jgi:hypothetical protein
MGNPPLTRGKALLIVPYFGRFGPWFELYLHGLASQHTLDLLLLSDMEPPPLPGNARRVEMTLDQLRERANACLPIPVRLERMRNICDLRPAYGIIFAEYTRDYPYWAFGDEDVLYGDVDKMLAPHLDGHFDFVVPASNGKSGHLTLIRNSARASELALTDPAYKDVLVSREHWAYDETSWRWGTQISSFHRVMKEAEARGELSIRWDIPRITGVPQRGRWFVYDGHALHEDHGREILYYHWGRMRHRAVRWPGAAEAARGFAFDRYGFYDRSLTGARLVARRGVGRLRELAGEARQLLRRGAP